MATAQKPKYFDTADATAKATDIKQGDSAYAHGELVNGTARVYVSGTTLYVPEGWISVHIVGS